MSERRRLWRRRTAPVSGSHFVETTHTRDRRALEAQQRHAAALKAGGKATPDPVAAEFDRIGAMIDLAYPDLSGIISDDVNQIMDVEGDRVFLEREIAQLCEPVEAHIPAYFREIDSKALRRQGRLDRSLALTYYGDIPVAWHVDPQDNSRRTYYYQFHYKGTKGIGRRTVLHYEQGLTLGETPDYYKQNLTHLSVGLNEQGQVHSLHIYPPHPSYIGKETARVPYGITRIDETPRLRSVLDVLSSLEGYNNGWVHLDFDDRKKPSITLAGDYTFTFTDKGFTLTEPKDDDHDLAGKLGTILTAQEYAFLVEEMLSLVELHDYAKQTEAIINDTI